MLQVCLRTLKITSISAPFLSQLLRHRELVVLVGQLIPMSTSQIFSYENANQVVWLSRCSFSTEQRPVPRRAASVDRRHPVGDRVPDLVRRIFLDEMDSRHCLLCQCRPPAYKVDQPVACENG